jgi:hypothetical protein
MANLPRRRDVKDAIRPLHQGYTLLQKRYNDRIGGKEHVTRRHLR